MQEGSPAREFEPLRDVRFRDKGLAELSREAEK